MYKKKFSPTKQRKLSKKFYGFDIETYNKNKNFLCASIVSENGEVWKFETKREIINFFKTKRFKNSIVSATNLQFDFAGTFYNQPEAMEFNMLWRGSELIYSKTHISNKEFRRNPKFSVHKKNSSWKQSKGSETLTFLDTGNYAKIPVKKWGEILGLPKLEHPSFLGKKPRNKAEWAEMWTYNIRDSEISMKATKFLYDTFQHLGATPKPTIASTAMSLFKNKYLKKTLWRHSVSILKQQFKGYYGGRVEVIRRGLIKNYNYYDINSLYPFVMKEYAYPDPNSLKTNSINNLKYINNFEGFASVEIKAPYMKYPLLPARLVDGSTYKLIFPTGTFSGVYTNVELRKALSLGYEIKKVFWNHYYLKTMRPFKEYVENLYSLRLQYKKEGSPMEYVVKILLNSLYGKFGQKFENRDNWQPMNLSKDELDKLQDFEIIGDYIRIKQPFVEPAPFTIPSWSAYVTSYARLKLFDYITKYKPAYYDTDSIITKSELPTSKKLGDMKLEMFIKKGILIKPKFYLTTSKEKTYSKIKGVGIGMTQQLFYKILLEGKVSYDKFMKFKESVRRGFFPNEIVEMTKHLNLNDNKRLWDGELNYSEEQDSEPLNLVDGKL